MPVEDTLRKFRAWMDENDLDGYLVPHADEFQNEYLPGKLDRLYKITGFKGSAGMALIKQDTAFLFVDGRYTLQAKKQACEEFQVLEVQGSSYRHCVSDKVIQNEKIGYDPMLLTLSQVRSLDLLLQKKTGSLLPIEINPVDTLFSKELYTTNSLFHHPLEYSGLSSIKKRQVVMEKTQADYLFLADLCSIAWVLNLRGFNIPYTPIFFSYALLHKDGYCDLFIQGGCKDNEAASIEKLSIHDFKDLKPLLKVLENTSISLDPNQTPFKIASYINKKSRLEEINPCLEVKACKNKVEQQGMIDCHVQDGAALVEFLYWVEVQVKEGKDVTEYQAINKLDALRSNAPLFVEPSFFTISATGPNGAVVHYAAKENTSQTLKKGDVYLVDSGGQYWNGTTDVTRTILFGETALKEQKEMYTRVLKGHINLALQIFPKGTSGADIDSLARQFLWEVGCDYSHSTGHGVGHFLNVHESPPGIGKRSFYPFKEGMVVSNEPGYYKKGHYGIRLENLLLISRCSREGFLKFVNLTLVPFENKLIDKELMTDKEINWLNDYHKTVWKKLSPFFDTPSRKQILNWLREKTVNL